MSESTEKETPQTEVLLESFESGDTESLTRLATQLHPADIAEVLDDLEQPADKLRLFNVLEAPLASEVARKCGEVTRGILVGQLPDSRLSAIIENLDTDDAADLVGELPEQRQRILLQRTSPEHRREVAELLTYDDDTAGGIMKTEVAAVSRDTTVREITEYLRSRAEVFHDIHNVFVTDETGSLVGYAALRDLMLANDGKAIGDIMETEVVSVAADIDQEEVAHLFEKYELLSIPVIDASEKLVGRITIDDIVDVIEEEATEDILRLAGVAAETVSIDGTAQGIRSRLPWLLLNLVTATLSVYTIALFEGTIRSIAVAAALMTIVASQGGNAGVQTMALVVRGLAIGEFDPSQLVRIVRRELLIALVNGLVLGSVSGIAVYLWRGDMHLSLVLTVAMMANFIIASVLGTLVPLGLKSLKVDPAISSSVLVTAGTDILGFFIFLGLLSWIL